MSARVKILSAKKYLALQQQKPANLVTLDCSWYPAVKDGYQEYLSEHIAGARYFNFNEIKTESPYPHMLPRTTNEFVAKAGEQGLRRSDHVVVYDRATYLSAPRVAWLLSTFDHPEVYLLDNYQEYKKLGGALASGEDKSIQGKPVDYLEGSKADSKHGQWLEYDDVIELVKSGAVKNGKVNLIDARGAERFTGATAEPRPGIQSGHIPGSKNIPFASVVDGSGHFKQGKKLADLLASQDINPEKRTVVLCGSGVTAVVVKAALDETYGGSAEIYDGSWSEWGQRAPAEYVERG